MNILQRRYPIGIQTFSEIREGNYVYIDKTDLVWEMANSVKYVFLSRPRRFGKSLLSTTLKSYFEGRKELFEGLKIMEYEKEWKGYPVIHIDLSLAKDKDSSEELRRYLNWMMSEMLKEGIVENETTPGEKLTRMIRREREKANGKVVVIIDEYDSPLLDVLHEKESLDSMRKVMREFYQPLKACESMIRFCFLTGITKFSQLSIFSTLNNISNVSMDTKYATICGITEQEMTSVLREDIERLAEEYECSYEEMCQRLKLQYDGYHFAKRSVGVYNPYSLMNCFNKMEIRNFWFESATPTFLFHQMQRFGTDITRMDDIVATESAFNRPTEKLTDALPLLYQAGYLTIKGYDRESDAYQLQIPNKEVRTGFAEGMLPFFSGVESDNVRLGCSFKMWKALKNGDVDQTLRELKAFLAGVPYVEGFKEKLKDAATKEGFYEYTFYLILSMLNVYVQTQVKCWTGRVDMTVFAPDVIYLFEFKVKGTAAKAIEQIDERHYADQYATDERKLVKVGVDFDINTWTIEDWKVVDC